MKAVRIATWNVNSIRARVDRVADWLERADVDVLAMQETKCPTTSSRRCRSRRWATRWRTAASTSGTAWRSRRGSASTTSQVGFDGLPTWGEAGWAAAEARALGATCGGVRVWSLYVPNGRELGDPHYAYKLDWLAALRKPAPGWLAADPTAQIALVGDWNIAPQDDDVWAWSSSRARPTCRRRSARRSPRSSDAGFADVVRPFTPGPGVYTYWDYTQLRFPKRRGMRIDFALCSPALAARVTARRSTARSARARGERPRAGGRRCEACRAASITMGQTPPHIKLRQFSCGFSLSAR